MHGNGRVAVHQPVAGCVGLVGRRDQFVALLEFGQQAVQRFRLLPRAHAQPSPSVSWTNSRSSKIEIIGSTRRNRNSSVKNRPSEPK